MKTGPSLCLWRMFKEKLRSIRLSADVCKHVCISLDTVCFIILCDNDHQLSVNIPWQIMFIGGFIWKFAFCLVHLRGNTGFELVN